MVHCNTAAGSFLWPWLELQWCFCGWNPSVTSFHCLLVLWRLWSYCITVSLLCFALWCVLSAHCQQTRNRVLWKCPEIPGLYSAISYCVGIRIVWPWRRFSAELHTPAHMSMFFKMSSVSRWHNHVELYFHNIL